MCTTYFMALEQMLNCTVAHWAFYKRESQR